MANSGNFLTKPGHFLTNSGNVWPLRLLLDLLSFFLPAQTIFFNNSGHFKLIQATFLFLTTQGIFFFTNWGHFYQGRPFFYQLRPFFEQGRPFFLPTQAFFGQLWPFWSTQNICDQLRKFFWPTHAIFLTKRGHFWRIRPFFYQLGIFFLPAQDIFDQLRQAIFLILLDQLRPFWPIHDFYTNSRDFLASSSRFWLTQANFFFTN